MQQNAIFALFLYCRPGFEAECSAEIQQRAGNLDIPGYCKAKPDSGYVVFHCYEAEQPARLVSEIDFSSLIFIRQWFCVLSMRNDLPVTDRVSSLLESLSGLPGAVHKIFLETPDTNEGKQLQALCRAISKPFGLALQKTKYWNGNSTDYRLHICFLSTSAAYIGYAPDANSSSWPMGIVRLRFPSSAPSRSTLKLEEALYVFLDDDEREKSMHAGQTAVDLGAAPGGWTWQLVRRSLHVIAVDNGAMDEQLMSSGMVEHLRVDGFRYQPSSRHDWMVCDMVEQPMRIAELVSRWLVNNWCRNCIFNLKLPMKKRYQEVQRCLDRVREQLDSAGIRYNMQAKQLYHDREEITVMILVHGN